MRILALKVRPRQPRAGKDAKKPEAERRFYEVQWHGRSETSMEREALVREEWPDLVKDWDAREQDRVARKHKRQPEGARAADGERDAKRQRTDRM